MLKPPPPQPGAGLLLLFGAIALLFGIFALLSPLSAAIALAWALGVMALAEGLIAVSVLFDSQRTLPRGWLVLYSIAALLFGLFTVLNPTATAGILILLLGAWLITGGLFRIVFAVRVRRVIQGEWLIALSGVLAIVLGVLFLSSPIAGLVATTLWVGVLSLLYGGVQIAAGILLRQRRPPA